MFLRDNLVFVEGVESSTIPPVRYLTKQSPPIGIASIPATTEPQSPSMPKASLSKSHGAAARTMMIVTLQTMGNLSTSGGFVVSKDLSTANCAPFGVDRD